MFARSNNPWTSAFTTATKVEAEGSKFFEGFLPTTRKATNTLSTITSTNGNDLNNDEEDVGGFCQPQHLALFVQSVNSSNPNLCVVESVEDTIDTEHGRILDAEKNNMGRQICRAWLKHHFLSLGNPCTQKNCERRHDVDGMNVGQLYKDFSFKGLATSQRNTIIKCIQASQGEALSTGNIHSSSSSSSSISGSSSSSRISGTSMTNTKAIATDLKRKQSDDATIGMETIDSSKVPRIDDIPLARTTLPSMNTTATTKQGSKNDRIVSAHVLVDPLYPRYTLEGERKRKNMWWLPWHRRIYWN